MVREILGAVIAGLIVLTMTDLVSEDIDIRAGACTEFGVLCANGNEPKSDASSPRLYAGNQGRGDLDTAVVLAAGDALVGQSYEFQSGRHCQVFGILGPYRGTVHIKDGEWWWLTNKALSAADLDELMDQAELEQRSNPRAGCPSSHHIPLLP